MEDKQILSAVCMAQALTPTRPEPTYGFMNYFLNRASEDGRRPWRSATAGTFWHIGAGTNASVQPLNTISWWLHAGSEVRHWTAY